jgi:hypothetical protein
MTPAERQIIAAAMHWHEYSYPHNLPAIRRACVARNIEIKEAAKHAGKRREE